MIVAQYSASLAVLLHHVNHNFQIKYMTGVLVKIAPPLKYARGGALITSKICLPGHILLVMNAPLGVFY